MPVKNTSFIVSGLFTSAYKNYKAPNDWQGDIVNKIKEYMKESDIFLNLHDGWGFHYPEHINWHCACKKYFFYSIWSFYICI